MTSGNARGLPHRFNRYATPQGERRAALATRGDRKWLECAKGGQPEKAPGGRGGDGFASVDAGTATVGGALAVVGPEPERRAPRSGSVTVAPAASMVRHCLGSAKLGSSRVVVIVIIVIVPIAVVLIEVIAIVVVVPVVVPVIILVIVIVVVIV